MTESSRRNFLRTAVLGGATAGSAVLLSAGPALAADCPADHKPGHRHCGCSTPPGPGGPGATQFQVRVVNNSANFQDLCLYQAPGDQGVVDPLSLAWMVEPAWPTTVVTFAWTTTYNFVWGQTGPLSFGTVFHAGQTWDADPTNPNLQQVQLDYSQGAFTFLHGSATSDPRPGMLYIKELSSIPIDTAVVGIGMAGAGTYIVPAMPNFNVVFTPHPTYWIAAGSFQTGEVLDTRQIPNPARIDFPPGVHSMRATLGLDNSWTVQPDTV